VKLTASVAYLNGNTGLGRDSVSVSQVRAGQIGSTCQLKHFFLSVQVGGRGAESWARNEIRSSAGELCTVVAWPQLPYS
jgi:hypothetical protein